MTALLELVAANPFATPDSVEEWRNAVDAQLGGPLVAGTTEEHETLGGCPALWIRPDDLASDAVVLYLHGGAYEVGSSTAYRPFASQVAVLTQATVVVPDYRRAPEHPFPAAIDDATATYRGLLDRGVAPGRIAVMGDSAGGGLTIATLVAAHRAQLPQPAAAVALSPWADLTMTADSYRRCSDTDPFLDAELLGASATSYLAGGDPKDPLASPVFAPSSALVALAPVLIQAAVGEVLVDDAATMARRIREAGGDVTVELWPDMTHVWHLLGSGVPESRDALDAVAAFIHAHWQ